MPFEGETGPGAPPGDGPGERPCGLRRRRESAGRRADDGQWGGGPEMPLAASFAADRPARPRETSPRGARAPLRAHPRRPSPWPHCGLSATAGLDRRLCRAIRTRTRTVRNCHAITTFVAILHTPRTLHSPRSRLQFTDVTKRPYRTVTLDEYLILLLVLKGHQSAICNFDTLNTVISFSNASAGPSRLRYSSFAIRAVMTAERFTNATPGKGRPTALERTGNPTW